MTFVLMLMLMLQPPGTQTRGLQSQDRVDGIQDLRLNTIEQNAYATNVRVDRLSIAIDELTNAMNRFTGIGIGMGAVLTLLQISQLIEIRRKNR